MLTALSYGLSGDGSYWTERRPASTVSSSSIRLGCLDSTHGKGPDFTSIGEDRIWSAISIMYKAPRPLNKTGKDCERGQASRAYASSCFGINGGHPVTGRFSTHKYVRIHFYTDFCTKPNSFSSGTRTVSDTTTKSSMMQANHTITSMPITQKLRQRYRITCSSSSASTSDGSSGSRANTRLVNPTLNPATVITRTLAAALSLNSQESTTTGEKRSSIIDSVKGRESDAFAALMLVAPLLPAPLLTTADGQAS